jgi:FkbM family methyltransferase
MRRRRVRDHAAPLGKSGRACAQAPQKALHQEDKGKSSTYSTAPLSTKDRSNVSTPFLHSAIRAMSVSPYGIQLPTFDKFRGAGADGAVLPFARPFIRRNDKVSSVACGCAARRGTNWTFRRGCVAMSSWDQTSVTRVRPVPASHVTALPEWKERRLPRPPLARKYLTSVLKRWVAFKHRWRLAHGQTRESFTTCRYFGAQFLIRLDDVIGWEMAIHRFEWRQILRVIDACQRFTPEVFIDVGANSGLYSCILGRRKLVPRIIAFEPDRRNLIHLRANLLLNGLLDAVEIREVALGAASASATLVPAGDGNRGLSRVVAAGTGGGYQIAVEALDDILSIEGRTIAVKIDVEGYEGQVLSGAASLFRKNSGFAQIEVLKDQQASIVATMEEFGWRLIGWIHDDLLFERP